MPEISAFCPGCGRSVRPLGQEEPEIPAGVGPLSIDALLGGIAYLSFVPAVILLLVPQTRRNQFVSFHAWQSVIFAVFTIIAAASSRLLFAVLSFLPFLGFLLAWLVTGLVALAIFFLWVLLIIKATLGESYELPWIGPLALRLQSSVSPPM